MKRTLPLKAIALVALPVALAGCGGSSGGPGGPGGISFLGFSQMSQPGTTTIGGIANAVDVELDAETGAVTSVSDFEATSNVTAQVSLDADGDVSAVTLNTTGGSRTFDASNSTLTPSGNLLIAERDDFTGTLVVADPDASGYEYQTFGAWTMIDGTGTGGRAGAMSVGAETAAANIDADGTATFVGQAAGVYVDGNGTPGIMTATATLNADFANRSVDFATSGSTIAGGGAADALDMTGTLAYGAGSNAMTGTVTTVGGLSGTADGRFYGPGAAEVGGVFGLRSPDGVQTLGGGFGAVRQ